MKKHLYHPLYLFLIFVFTLSLASAQTSLWLLFFSSLSAPLLWFPIIIYLYLYRPYAEGILTSYFLLFFLAPLTSMPVGLLFFIFLILWVIIQFIKNFVFEPHPKYFVLTTTLTCLAYQIMQWLFSILLENGPAKENLVFADRGWQFIVTPLVAFPIYKVLCLLDQVTKQEKLIKKTV